MAIPKLKKSRHHSSDEILKLHHIIYLLRGMGYDIDDARSVIDVIENFNLDKTKFEYPYNTSFRIILYITQYYMSRGIIKIFTKSFLPTEKADPHQRTGFRCILVVVSSVMIISSVASGSSRRFFTVILGDKTFNFNESVSS